MGEIPPRPDLPKPKFPKQWTYLAIILVIVTVFGIGVARSKRSAPRISSSTQTGTLNTPGPSPTPFQFQELTIPYLRSRTYKSALRDRTVNYQADSYTAYDTSYESDNLKINGILTIPAGEKPAGGWPAIVFVHGYIPPAQYGGQYYDYVDYLARNGFVVFKIDLRGHAQSEGTASGAYYSGDYIVDTLNARAALMSADFVNPKKVGLWGHSMAGNVTFRSLATIPDIPAVAIWGGAVYTYADRLKYGIQDASYRPPQQQSVNQSRQRRIRELYGEFDNNNWFWKQLAPTNYLSDIRGAVSLHHAVDDDVVNIGYSRDLNALLDKTSIPHALHEYPSGGHNISGASFVAAMQDTIAFYNKYLK